MSTTIRAYVKAQLEGTTDVQKGLLDPQDVAFKRIFRLLAAEVAKKQ